MKTCADCLHYDLCNELNGVEYPGPCDYFFKDKNKFLELPCPIGETVFMITKKYDTYDGDIYHTIIQVPFRINLLHLINIIIFLTREEAEKKLEELK